MVEHWRVRVSYIRIHLPNEVKTIMRPVCANAFIKIKYKLNINLRSRKKSELRAAFYSSISYAYMYTKRKL